MRGACKPAHYKNLDYSRFGAFDHDDEDDEPARANFVSLRGASCRVPDLHFSVMGL